MFCVKRVYTEKNTFSKVLELFEFGAKGVQRDSQCAGEIKKDPALVQNVNNTKIDMGFFSTILLAIVTILSNSALTFPLIFLRD